MAKPFLADTDLTIWQGDALEVMRGFADESVHCVVTSPPYWGLRDYGAEGQLGLEATPALYVEHMVEVFREVWRVLRKDGTCWLNIGDSYFGDSPPRKKSSEAFSETWDPAVTASRGGLRRSAARTDGLKPKDLCMIPHRLAIALQEDGWWVRADNIWNKPNPMPESVTDRPTQSQEHVFLLTRSPRYYYDQEAVREAFETRPQQRLTSTADQPGGPGRAAVGGQNPECQGGTDLKRPAPQAETLGDLPPEAPRGADGRRKTKRVEYHEGRQTHENYENAYGGERWPGGGRNMRNVWTIPTEPYPGAHFAVFPQELVRRCILAGSPLGGTVLDPFGGSGTTAYVARASGRRALLIELSEDYCSLIEKRTQQLSLLGGEAA